MKTNKVVDLSKWNAIKDYYELAKVCDGVIIRAGYRGYSSQGTLQEDNRFREHVKGCIAANIPIGLYFMSQALNADEGRKEAMFIATLAKDIKISLPIFIDSELSGAAGNTGRADNINAKDRTAACNAFCAEIASRGYQAGVYSGKSWFENNLVAKELESYLIWVAQYNKAKVLTYKGKYDLWQFTSEYKNPAISAGNLDMSEMYINDIQAQAPESVPNAPKTLSGVLKKGSKGEDVKELQRKLNGAGNALKVDGDFGAKTDAAVRKYQSTKNLVVDGKVGVKTWGALLK